MSQVYFGEHWGVPALQGAKREKTPVGQECWWCKTKVAEGDRGFIDVAVSPRTHGVSIKVVAIHRECQLRDVVGGIAHLMGYCQHPGQCNELADGVGLTPREDALLVWDWVQRHGIPASR